eukprot:scpid61661/ scgid13098/ 
MTELPSVHADQLTALTKSIVLQRCSSSTESSGVRGTSCPLARTIIPPTCWLVQSYPPACWLVQSYPLPAGSYNHTPLPVHSPHNHDNDVLILEAHVYSSSVRHAVFSYR